MSFNFVEQQLRMSTYVPVFQHLCEILLHHFLFHKGAAIKFHVLRMFMPTTLC